MVRFGSRWVAGVVVFLGVALLGPLSGCVSLSRSGNVQAEAEARVAGVWPDAIFYVDGAGGGGPITDATPEIRSGLTAAGFSGEFRPFRWQTGLGAMADQCTSAEYKRECGAKLAGEIRALREARPGARVGLIASSAGTAVAVFALEQLDAAHAVSDVTLMSSAMSARYDLSAALANVTGRVNVLASERDSLLKVVVPLVGVSDRERGAAAAGIRGFEEPAGASASTHALYAKVRTLQWQPEYAQHGNGGGHTDCKSPRFIQHVVGPLMASAGADGAAFARAE